MGSRVVISLAVCVLLTCVEGDSKKPNFLIIFADDMGYGDMSCVGHPTINTPSLDKLAAEGTRFTQWYSGHPICSPSRAAMMTGRLAIRSGCAGADWSSGVFRTGSVGGLPESEVTLAELVKPSNYSTLAVGKWHLGQRKQFLPTAQGFDEFFGIPYSVDMGVSPWSTGQHWLPVLPLMHNEDIIEQPVDLSTLSERYYQKAVKFMAQNLEEDKPFLLYLAWNHVHTPDFASEEFCKSSSRGRYGDAIEEMDYYIGKTLEGLRAAGGEENTVVVFTSDNGPWLIMRLIGGSAGPFFEGKSTTWEGGIREPGIVKWPGRVRAGAVSQELVTTYDLFPTVAALSHSPLPEGVEIDGQDLSRVITGEESNRASRCLMIYHGTPSTLPPDPEDPKPGLWAVRCGAYKAHFVTGCAAMHLFGDKRCAGPPGPAASASQANSRNVRAETNLNSDHPVKSARDSQSGPDLKSDLKSGPKPGQKSGQKSTEREEPEGAPSLNFELPVSRCEVYSAMAQIPDCEDFITLQEMERAVFHDPPLLFHLEMDPGEQHPLPPSSPEYKAALETILAARRAHEATLSPVVNQMALGQAHKYEVCCDPNSQAKYPEHPPCTCNPENWNAFVCTPVDDNPAPYWPEAWGSKRGSNAMVGREEVVT